MIDTNNLWQELMKSPNLDQFLSEHKGNFQTGSVCDLLNQLFQKRRISKAALAKQSGMSEVYLHQVFAGETLPGTVFCAFASGSAQRWRRRRSF